MKIIPLLLLQLCLFLPVACTPVLTHSGIGANNNMTTCKEGLMVAKDFPESGMYEQLLNMPEDECLTIMNQHSTAHFRELLEGGEPMKIEVDEEGNLTYIRRPVRPDSPDHRHDEQDQNEIEELIEHPHSTQRIVPMAVAIIEMIKELLTTLEELLLQPGAGQHGARSRHADTGLF